MAMAEGRRGEVSQSWFSSEKRIGPRGELGRRQNEEGGIGRSRSGRKIFITEASDLQSVCLSTPEPAVHACGPVT